MFNRGALKIGIEGGDWAPQCVPPPPGRSALVIVLTCLAEYV